MEPPRTRTKCERRALAVLLGALCLGGCLSFDHSYFVKVQDPVDGPETPQENYYRITLKGKTFFALTSFRHGWYDRVTIEKIFGGLDMAADGGRTADGAPPTSATLVANSSIAVEMSGTSAVNVYQTFNVYNSVTQIVSVTKDGTPVTTRTVTQSTAAPVSSPTIPHVPGEPHWRVPGPPSVEKPAENTNGDCKNCVVKTPKPRIHNASLAMELFDANGHPIDTKSQCLVVFLHTNADAFARQLSNLASDDAMSHDIVSLLTVREQEEVLEAEGDRDDLRELADSLKPGTTSTEIARLLNVLRMTKNDVEARGALQELRGLLVMFLRDGLGSRRPEDELINWDDVASIREWLARERVILRSAK
jgi:hypothetical protein